MPINAATIATVMTFISSILIASVASSEEKKYIHVPAQPLAAAIAELGEETGLQVIAAGPEIDGEQSSEVVGEMTPTQALTRMLEGTGLRIETLDDAGSLVSSFDFVSQNATEDDAFDLGTLVISGELIERTAQDSQTSAVIVTGAEIEARSETRVEDIVNRTPGVEINRNGFRIRGIRQNGVAGAGTGGLINTTVDGARVSDLQEVNPAEISTWDVDQFEILRGPQSTQTGRNALAGAVNIRTNDPVYDDEVRLRFGYGSFNERQVALVYNTPIVADRLAFRLAIDKRETDGFLEDTNKVGSEPGAQDLLTARASLRFDVTPDFSAILKYTHNDNSYQPFEVNSETFPDLNVSITGASIVDVEYDTWNLRFEYDLRNNLVLSSETNLNQANGLRRFGDRASGLLDFVTDDRTIDQEFKLSFETERLRGVVGLFYADIETESVTTTVNSVGPFTLENIVDIRDRRINYAIFGEAEYDLTERSRLIFGARYDVDEFDRDFGFVLSSNAPSPPFPPNSTGIVPTTGSFDAFLPKLGYVYDLTENSTIGLTYQRGYRSGGASINLGTSIPEPFEFQPEYTDTIELSYRSASADGRFVLNANAFYTNWQDQQVRVDFPPQPGG
ncbi:MAG: TonB-dependent receptor, partial [Pseudomonadota bacterium]